MATPSPTITLIFAKRQDISTLASDTTLLVTDTADSDTSSPDSTTTLAIGITLGVVAAILCIIVAFVGWWRYRAEKKADISRIYGKVEMIPDVPPDTESQYDLSSQRSNRSGESLSGFPGGLASSPEGDHEQQPTSRV